MKYCKSCRRLFNCEETVCSECKKGLDTVADENTPVFLVSASGFEKERIIAALEDKGIPTDTKRMKKSPSADAITGFDIADVGILVPYQAYEKAYDTCVGIGAIREENEQIIDDGEPMQKAEPEDKPVDRTSPGARAGRILLAVMFLIIAAFAIFATDAITGFIMKLLSGN